MPKIIIEGTLPSMNEIIDTAKMGRGKYSHYASMKRVNTDLVAWTCKSQLKGFKFERVDIAITWYCPDKMKDPDNIMAGQKFILDGLVNSKVIPGDGWKQINNISHKFAIDRDNSRIEVVITEA